MKKRQKQRKVILYVCSAVTVLVLIVALVAGLLMKKQNAAVVQKAEGGQNGNVDPLEEWGYTVNYDGKRYTRKDRMTVCLFMGVDDRVSESQKLLIGNGARADTLLLLILDNGQQTTKVVEISRDTMTMVDVFNREGRKAYSGEMQINMQFAFGDSMSRSSQLTKQTVSRLLNGIRIDSYFALTIDGISAVIDELGGITLTMNEDYTEIDEQYKKGATVFMDGQMVERFVRQRDTEESGSNETRMTRQAWFIREFFNWAQDGRNLNYETFLDVLSPYLETDMDADSLKAVTSYKLDEDIVKLPGENHEGTYHDEFVIDDEGVQRLLLGLLYDEADDDDGLQI